MYQELRSVIEQGGLAVVPTDTIYGVVANAFDVNAVEQLYEIKDRDRSKPLIVLISDSSQMQKFGIPPKFQRLAEQYWPGPVSVAVPHNSKRWSYITRGSGYMAFRLPEPEKIQSMVRAIGPIVAPSANPEGLPPAQTIEEAQDYFGDTVQQYIDAGKLTGNPSKLIRINPSGQVDVIRSAQGDMMENIRREE